MFRFLVREIAGWLLVLLGLGILLLTIALLLESEPRICEASATSIVGIVVFRGGIQLLKVAVAARIAMQAQREMEKQTENPKAAAKTPYDW